MLQTRLTGSSDNNKRVHTILRVILLMGLIGTLTYVIIDFNNLVLRLEKFCKWVQTSDDEVAGVFAGFGVYILAEALFFPRSLLAIGAGYVLHWTFKSTLKSCLIGIPMLFIASLFSNLI